MPNRDPNSRWTKEQTIVALYTYCTIPFKESRAQHPYIIEIAELISRSPSALNMKVGNFGRLDPTLAAQGISGLGHGSKLDEEVWPEFYGDFERLALVSQAILERLRNGQRELSLDDLPTGENITVEALQRINQDFFRSMVLTAYNNMCCITGIRSTEVLEACHIVGWQEDAENRTNPRNGLCLTRTLHKAYDEMLMAITPDYEVKISDKFIDSAARGGIGYAMLKEINGSQICMPDRFAPSRDLLDIHYQSYLMHA